ncbi:MAG TPA: ATP-binding protein [Candidatus Omnitrophota bacterium]|mgnify:CR=1 FL=1|nr:ATP-binding protein [Candidatus Omnitrophota bacterium]
MGYIERHIESRLKEALDIHPVVILSGPRQVGKSTLLQNAACLKGWRYITLDDSILLEQAKEDPQGLLLNETPIIIDEIQRCPELLVTIKYYVDQSKRKRRFILSGSGNVSLRGAPRETLAGRARYLHLTGFSYAEIQNRKDYFLLDRLMSGKEITSVESENNASFIESAWKGGLPEIVLASKPRVVSGLMSGYVDTYIERDIQDLVKIRYPQNFRRLMQALAKATGWESQQEELAKISGETRSNVSRHMSLLKNTQLLYELRGFMVRGETAYKQAKYYWFDSGVACFMAGISSAQELKKENIKGRFLENFIFQQLLVWASLQQTQPEFYYWKSKQTHTEVDFIIKHRDVVLPIEVKSGDSLDFRDTRSIREFLKGHPDVRFGVIIYTGKKLYPVASNVWAVPWYQL